MKPFLLSLICFCFFAASNATPAKDSTGEKNAVKDTSSIKHIYLTFDDGPLDGSEDINDAVTKEQIKINVFIVGQHEESSKKMKRYYQSYLTNPLIEVGNHSFSHAHDKYKAFYDNPEAVLADFLKCQTELQIPNKFARQPGRSQWRLKDLSVNDVSSGSISADLLYKNGFKVFGWDIEWQHDGKTGTPIQTVDDMVELIEKRLEKKETVRPGHLVLLSHDEMFRNGWEESELKELIEKLRAKGNYQFEHLSQYPD